MKNRDELIEGATLAVSPILAQKIGLNEALFLHRLHYWLQRSKRECDGHLWVCKTYEEWQNEIPFWSIDTVKRTIKKLEKAELVISSIQYNISRFDKTKWYTVNYGKVDEMGIGRG